MLLIKSLSILYGCIRYTLYPFWPSRKKFERKNESDIYARLHPNKDVSFCFHVSSEGEFEQIVPLAEKALKGHNTIEILYTSPSVEQAVQLFCRKYEGHVFSLRLPLLLGGTSKWVRGNCFIMVRYDFYPPLLELAQQKNSFLIHATLKNKKRGILRKKILSLFSGIVPATKKDETIFKEWGFAQSLLPWFDFRVVRIEQRLDRASKKLKHSSPTKLITHILHKKSPKRKIIFGSFYEEESAIFQDPTLREDICLGKSIVLIVPHHTQKTSIDRIISSLKGSTPVYRVSKLILDDYERKPGILLFETRGYLLELYTLFNWAYVGGGHGRSVHSLLEPFMAGLQVFCGPQIFRSTEYDLIYSLNKETIHIVDELQTFYSIGKRYDKKEKRPFSMGPIKKNYEQILEKMQL